MLSFQAVASTDCDTVKAEGERLMAEYNAILNYAVNTENWKDSAPAFEEYRNRFCEKLPETEGKKFLELNAKLLGVKNIAEAKEYPEWFVLLNKDNILRKECKPKYANYLNKWKSENPRPKPPENLDKEKTRIEMSQLASVYNAFCKD